MIRTDPILLGVERLDLLAGDRLEQGLTLLEARVDLVQPLVCTAPRFGLNGHGESLSGCPGSPVRCAPAARAYLEEGRVCTIDQVGQGVALVQLGETHRNGAAVAALGERVLNLPEARLRVAQIDSADGADEFVTPEPDDRLV